MRVSSSMLQRNALRGLGRNLDQLVRAQEDASTGRRIHTISDDPVSAAQVMRLDAHLRDVEQFRRNSAVASTRLSAEDVVLDTARELLARARNLALSGATESPSDPLRQIAISEIRSIHDQLVSLGNTRIGNEYIFGGGQTTNPPFRSDGTFVGDDTVRVAVIDDQVTLDTNHTGDALFTTTFAALDALSLELDLGSPTSILSRVSDVSAAEQDLLLSQTQVGSRLRNILSSGEHLTARATDLTDRRELLRDVDPAESVANVLAAQTALERAYAVVGRVLSTNFLDYFS